MVPWILEIDAIGVTTNEVLGENHYEALKMQFMAGLDIDNCSQNIVFFVTDIKINRQLF